MPRMIDTSEATTIISDYFDAICDTKYTFDEAVLLKLLNNKAVDAVPVIRCKDCKHWDGHYCHEKWWGDGYGNYTPPIKTADGFCDWADRREE